MRPRIVNPSVLGRAALCALVLLAGAGSAAQQGKPPPAAAPSAPVYRSDVQACHAGTSGQDLETCLKEARHARAARLRGDLDTDLDALQANSVRRCNVFEGEMRAACLARMAGRGSTSGSVAGGGILREVETVVLPADSGPVRIVPRTQDPVILVPDKR